MISIPLSNNNEYLYLDSLKKGKGMISEGFGAYMAEACAYCLSEQGHTSGVSLSITHDRVDNFPVKWDFIMDEAIRASHNNDKLATEFGAYAIALLLIELIDSYELVQTSKIGTGFDFWLKKRDSILFQGAVRLEVSGIKAGDDSIVKKRLTQKIAQASKGKNIIGYVVIVEFGKPLAAVGKL
jgi:hypothetical protein